MTGNRHSDASHELEAHLDELGGALERGVARADQRRRRSRFAAGSVTAIAAVGLGALVALPGGRDLDPVAEARAAVGEGNAILHFVMRSQWQPPAGSSIRPSRNPQAIEVWTAMEGEDRYRVRAPADEQPRY